MYMIDAKFTKIFKDMGSVCHQKDVKTFLFCQKNYAKKKWPIFLLQLLSWLMLNSACSLKNTGRHIFTFKYFIWLITKNMWPTCFSGSFRGDNGPTSVPNSVRGGPREEPHVKARCKLQNAPKMFLFLIS